MNYFLLRIEINIKIKQHLNYLIIFILNKINMHFFNFS